MAISDAQILLLRTQRDDCRNYIILGDSAVRLKPEPLIQFCQFEYDLNNLVDEPGRLDFSLNID